MKSKFKCDVIVRVNKDGTFTRIDNQEKLMNFLNLLERENTCLGNRVYHLEVKNEVLNELFCNNKNIDKEEIEEYKGPYYPPDENPFKRKIIECDNFD